MRQPGAPRYDAVLIDEGQDYRLTWWNALRLACKEDGEMLLVADRTQDVYGTAEAWTDEAMIGAGFSGPWNALQANYRLPRAALEAAREFAARFLPARTMDLPAAPVEGEFAIEPCALRWVQCETGETLSTCIRELKALMLQTGEKGLANADITFLTDETSFGRMVVEVLNRDEIRTVATFDEDERERRREKMGFYMGDARIKATTLHSFKGWEARLLIVHVSKARGADSRALIYAGLTRLKLSPLGSWLTVVCSTPELADYGRTWPDQVEVA